MRVGFHSAGRSVAGMFGLLAVVGSSLALAPAAQAQDAISGACGRDYDRGVIHIDGDVNKPVELTAAKLAALPGQETLNITFLNHLGAAQSHSETGPTLWTALNIAAGGIKVPPPTPNEYVGEPAAITTLYVMVIGTDGYETLISEAEIDPQFGNAPILLGWAEDDVVLDKVPYNSEEFKGPAQLVVPTDSHGGRYANQICRIKVLNGAL